MRLLTVIPARLGSTRLPNKPLRLLAGEPLIRVVVRNALAMELPGEVVVATDHAAVADAVGDLGVHAVLTDRRHRSGTERVHQVVTEHARYRAAELVLNLQGDEPFVPRVAVDGALARVAGGDDIGTAAHPLSPEEWSDPHRVKVEVDPGGRAIRFFRLEDSSYHDVLQHIGIYAFTVASLKRWMRLPDTPGALAGGGLEQLRPLCGGMTIGVAVLDRSVPSGVDTEADLRIAEAIR